MERPGASTGPKMGSSTRFASAMPASMVAGIHSSTVRTAMQQSFLPSSCSHSMAGLVRKMRW